MDARRGALEANGLDSESSGFISVPDPDRRGVSEALAVYVAFFGDLPGNIGYLKHNFTCIHMLVLVTEKMLLLKVLKPEY